MGDRDRNYERDTEDLQKPDPIEIEGCRVLFYKARGVYCFDEYGGAYIGKHIITYIFCRLANKTFFRIKRFWTPRSKRIKLDNFWGRTFGFYKTVNDGFDILQDDYEPISRIGEAVVKALCGEGVVVEDAIGIVHSCFE